MEDRRRLPYKPEYDYRWIKHVRMIRSKTQADMETFMGVDRSTIGKLERNELEFSPLYQEKFKQAILRLRISNVELASIRKIIELKELRRLR